MGSKFDLDKYLQPLSRGEIEFLELMSGQTCIEEMTNSFIDPDVFKPKYSPNGALLLITSGMEIASSIRDDIYDFLAS